jgi:hypothetical protein
MACAVLGTMLQFTFVSGAGNYCWHTFMIVLKNEMSSGTAVQDTAPIRELTESKLNRSSHESAALSGGQPAQEHSFSCAKNQRYASQQDV